ncbi:hypothetical protein ACJEDT_26130 (plasmid) [Rhodococcoides fascians]|uniref:hypothetical protein n=1 Tax=Rhodococcoides fascians TaxID=1828 RepID=UPI00389B31BD
MPEHVARTAQAFANRGHHRGAPLRRAFLSRDIGPARTPLERLLSSKAGGSGGGRGGRTRLALLLTLIWVSAGESHASARPARWWAEMIGITDPQRGARVVTANFKTLADRGFITVDHSTAPPTVTLLDELGTRGPYNRPDGKDGLSYFRIPETLWTSGVIGTLSGPGLAMYLVLLYYHRRDRPGMWLSPSYFHEHHGLSDGTRLDGITDLYTQGVISVKERVIDNSGGTENRTFPRRILTLDRHFAPPAKVVFGGGTPTPRESETPPEYRPVSGSLQL